LNIARDPFADSEEFENYERSKMYGKEINEAADDKNTVLTDDVIPSYQAMNPEFWQVYYQSGKYYFSKKEYSKAKIEFEKALTKEITTIPDRKNVEKYLKKTLKKLK